MFVTYTRVLCTSGSFIHLAWDLLQALIQKEQLREELVNMRNRLEDHVEEITRKLSEERDLVRLEYKQEKEELTDKVSTCS